jgi:hypothetical protein
MHLSGRETGSAPMINLGQTAQRTVRRLRPIFPTPSMIFWLVHTEKKIRINYKYTQYDEITGAHKTFFSSKINFMILC